MHVQVNDEPARIEGEDGLTLADLLDELRSSGGIAADEVVVGVEVDGQQWSADDLENRQQDVLPRDTRVAIATDSSRGYALRILSDAAGMIDGLREAAGSVAKALRDGSTEQANADLFRLLEAVQRLLVCLHQVQNVYELEHGLSSGDDSPLGRMSDALQQMQSCQQQQDWPALAGALTDDLVPALQSLDQLTEQMRSEL